EPPPAAYYWRGAIYLRLDEWTLALADFDRVLAESSHDPQFLYWRAYAFLQRQEWEKLRAALQQLEAINPQHPQLDELQGHLWMAEGRYEEAERAYSQALERRQADTTVRYNRAVVRHRLGHRDTARRDLEAILRIEPNHLGAHLELTGMAFEEEEYDVALQHARTALVVDDTLFEARFSEAATLMALEANEEARESLGRLRADYHEKPFIEQLYGELLASEGETVGAIASYRRVLAAEPENHQVRLKVAGELITLHHFEEAQQEIAQVLEEDPDNLDALATRADLYRYSNQPDAMRADLDDLLECDPCNAWALTYRAAHRQWAGDAAGAQVDYDEALASDSTQGWIWAFRGQFHLRHKRLGEAREDFQQAITLDPEEPWIRHQWTTLLSANGHRERAAEVLDCLVADYPDDGFARLARAELHLLAEEWAAARVQLAAIVESGHELGWLAHAALAVLAKDEAREQHLALADAQRPESTFWGVTPAYILAQRALVAWQRGNAAAAGRSLTEAQERLEPGETLWRGLHPLLVRLGAASLLAVLDDRESVPA
ncbi:MAG: tetratricopeptide repeat protein, partial [Ardenticatenaceae bacterium]